MTGSEMIYRHKAGGLRTRIMFFGPVAGLLILGPLLGFYFTGTDGAFPDIVSMILGLGILTGLGIVVKAEREGRPCIILGADSFTFHGYRKTTEAKWSELEYFTMGVSVPSSRTDHSSNDAEPTYYLQASRTRGGSETPPRRKPDFRLPDYFEIPLNELRPILNRRIELARARR